MMNCLRNVAVDSHLPRIAKPMSNAFISRTSREAGVAVLRSSGHQPSKNVSRAARTAAVFTIAAAALALPACKKSIRCAPGTVFVELPCPPEAESAGRAVKSFALQLTRVTEDSTPVETSQSVDGSCPTTLELTVPDYGTSKSVRFVATPTYEDDTPGAAMVKEVALTGSCAVLGKDAFSTGTGGASGEGGSGPALGGAGGSTGTGGAGGTGGTPSSACESGQHLCDGVCVPNKDPLTCGGSCSACKAPQNGTATCDGEKCGGSCPEGRKLCLGSGCIPQDAACEGSCPTGQHACEDLCAEDGDPNTCGTRCTPCPKPDHSKANCDAGTCGFECDAGYHRCGDSCRADNDALACGDDCETCATAPNGVAMCVDGSCTVECKEGFRACGGQCLSNVSVETSCGTACTSCATPAGGMARCEGGACKFSCPIGQKVCINACVPENQACEGTCPAGTHACDGLCLSDLSAASCGDRCTACPLPANAVGALCQSGGCDFDRCESGFHRCGDVCVRNDDVNKCGDACVKCATDPNGTPVCRDDVCGLKCKNGYHECDGKCVRNDDPNTCGSRCSPCNTAPNGGRAGCDGTRCLALCDGAKPVLCQSANSCIAENVPCAGACEDGRHPCGGLCVEDSPSTCGDACVNCDGGEGVAQDICTEARQCEVVCENDYKKCGSVCRKKSDPKYCLNCGACPNEPNGELECVGGTCQVKSCKPGYCASGGKCVDATTLQNCGLSCNPCGAPPTGGGMVCSAGECKPTCPSEQYVCGDRCIGLTQACNGMCQTSGTRNCGGLCKANDRLACGSSCDDCSTKGPTKGSGTGECDGSSCYVACSAPTPRPCAGTRICVANNHPACCSNSDCDQPPSSNRSAACDNNVCSYPCSDGYRECNGACLPEAAPACCTSSDCTGGNTCNASKVCSCPSNLKSCPDGTCRTECPGVVLFSSPSGASLTVRDTDYEGALVVGASEGRGFVWGVNLGWTTLGTISIPSGSTMSADAISSDGSYIGGMWFRRENSNDPFDFSGDYGLLFWKRGSPDLPDSLTSRYIGGFGGAIMYHAAFRNGTPSFVGSVFSQGDYPLVLCNSSSCSPHPRLTDPSDAAEVSVSQDGQVIVYKLYGDVDSCLNTTVGNPPNTEGECFGRFGGRVSGNGRFIFGVSSNSNLFRWEVGTTSAEKVATMSSIRDVSDDGSRVMNGTSLWIEGQGVVGFSVLRTRIPNAPQFDTAKAGVISGDGKVVFGEGWRIVLP